jgi:hypothetical protein
VQVGETFTASVAVNASGNYVEAADVELTFDPAVITAVRCLAGSDVVSTQGFECRFNIYGNLDSMQISYADSGMSAGASVSAADAVPFELAVVTFQACLSHKCRAPSCTL